MARDPDSPFPGMDPYLESRWSDVHSSLIQAAKEALQPQLSPGLRARSEERVLVEEGGEPVGRYRSDIAVVVVSHSRPAAGPTGGAAAVRAPPVVVEFPPEPAVERWLEIVDTLAGNRVVTAIEVLSPANKIVGEASRAYQRKVADYAAASVHLVEVDLLRSSRARLRLPRTALPAADRTPYLACVRRADAPHHWECYPIGLRAALPAIAVPLRPGESDVTLDLQPLLTRAYAAGGHDDVNYARDPDPPLSAEDAAWADGLLRAAGRRP